ncbi:MAG TPA: UbiD family decarboxylase [Syntrophales bacterium]|nr:UbiD family decarboxylase [Syntrophales bacterium]
MPYNDLREFIDRLKKTGDLIDINEEVDWNLEAGAIMRRAYEKWQPAQLFNKIKGYKKGFRLMGGPLATFRRLAVGMGMDPETSYTDMLNEFDKRSANPIKPMVVSDGPCKENILKGKDVDLLKFPVPLIHGGDGGRFIGTWNVGICKDLDSDWVNWGTYRLMVHDKASTGAFVLPQQHIGMMYGKYEEKNLPMPYAAAIGLDPMINFIATTGVPYGVNEVDIVGGMRNEPVRLVKCETLDLYVPATAEIVLEGEILPRVRKDEGPFGEYPGYQLSGTVARPVFKIKCITHRNNAILTAACIGVPPDDYHIAGNLGQASYFKNALLNEGIPVTGIFFPPQSAMHLCIVAVKTAHTNMATKVANIIWGTKNGFVCPRVVVVDEDVDPTDLDQVLHAFSTKCHPIKGTTVIDNSNVSPLTGFLWPGDRELGLGANVVYDCTWPKQWRKEDVPTRSSFNDTYPEDIKKRVLSKWKKYGFK